jgi:hypothetical protein
MRIEEAVTLAWPLRPRCDGHHKKSLFSRIISRGAQGCGFSLVVLNGHIFLGV